MKKETPIRDLYKHLVKLGKLPRHDGLCLEISDHLNMFERVRFGEIMSPNEYHDYLGYWGSGTKKAQHGVFTELRQNLLLLWAAYNNEL